MCQNILQLLKNLRHHSNGKEIRHFKSFFKNTNKMKQRQYICKKNMKGQGNVWRQLLLQKALFCWSVSCAQLKEPVPIVCIKAKHTEAKRHGGEKLSTLQQSLKSIMLKLL
jgi:hypothetical protein